MFLQETYAIEDCLQAPKLDGTETIYQISGTTTTNNGEMSGGSSYLSTGFNNSGNWELTCQVKFTGNNCAFLLFPDGATSRDANECGVTAYRDSRVIWYNSGTYNRTNGTRALSTNTYYTLKIVKNNSSLVFTIDSDNKTVSTWNQTSSASILHIGLGGWGTSGNVCTVKNIKVKAL